MKKILFILPLLVGCGNSLTGVERWNSGNGFYYNTCHPEMGLTLYPPEVEPPCQVVWIVGDDAVKWAAEHKATDQGYGIGAGLMLPPLEVRDGR